MPAKNSRKFNMRELRPEVLVLRGRLYPDLKFELRRSYSTFEVLQWPEHSAENYRLELTNEQGQILNRAKVQVTPERSCEKGGERYERISGYIGLSPGAEELNLYKEDLLISSLRIPPAATVTLDKDRIQPDKAGNVKLTLRTSKLYEGAYVQVIYQWAARGFRTLGFHRPDEPFNINVDGLPGGKKCRLVLIYSNGLRSASTTTNYFVRPELEFSCEVVVPENKADFPPWVPVNFKGCMVDPHGHELDDEDHLWLLNGKEVHRGVAGSLENLPDGKYKLALTTSCKIEGHKQPVSETNFTVRRPKKCAGTPAQEWDSN